MPDTTVSWFSTRAQYDSAVRPGLTSRRVAERALAASPTRPGRCLACDRDVVFVVPSGSWFADQPDLREGWRCPECGCNNRQRLLLHGARELLGTRSGAQVYLAEAFSPLAILLRDGPWALTLSDYVSPRARSGSTLEVVGHSVVHQDLTATSLPSGSFDLVMHAEVLEHVPAWRAVLRETTRLVRPGGWTVFTAPFLHDRDDFLVRAVEDERWFRKPRTRELLPREVHGAPLHPEGVLVYQVPGWSLLDAMEEAGLEDVRIGWLSDPDLGITSNNSDHDNYMEPVLFAGRKPGTR